MKNSHGKTSAALVIILFSLLIAAVGWYSYFQAKDKSRSLEAGSRIERERLESGLNARQSQIEQLQENELVLLSSLEEEKKSRQDMSAMFEKLRTDVMALEGSLEQVKNDSSLAANDLRQQLVGEQEARQQTLVKQQALQTSLQKATAANLDLETKLAGKRVEIDKLKTSEATLTAALNAEAQKRVALADLLQKTRTDDQVLQSSLQADRNKLMARESSLQAELEDEKRKRAELLNQLQQVRSENQTMQTRLRADQDTLMARESSLQAELEDEKRKRAELLNQLQQVRSENQTMQTRLRADQGTLMARESSLQAELEDEKRKRAGLVNQLQQMRSDNQSLQTSLQESRLDAQQGIALRESKLAKQRAIIEEMEAGETVMQLFQEHDSQAHSELLQRHEKAIAEINRLNKSRQELESNYHVTIAELQADNQRQKTAINTVTQTAARLESELNENRHTSAQLALALDKSRAQNLALEEKRKQEISKVMLTTAELEAELARRKEQQNSLAAVIDTVSGEKTQLQIKLEQEQQSKQQIAGLKARLEQELNETRVEISELKNRMTVITLTNEVLFGSGSATIKPDGKKVLSIIADSLSEYENRAISVEGHTDNVPIGPNSYYDSNWSLSVARGLAAVDFFRQGNLLEPTRMRVVGYGEHRPISSNNSAEGRARNRRIEIRVLPPGLVEPE